MIGRMLIGRVLTVTIVSALWFSPSAHAAPVDSTFSYQGRLTNSGVPVTGLADVTFSLWDADAGGAQIGADIVLLNVPVADGLFNVDLDFGVASLDGEQRWLEIEARSPAGVGGYTLLSPRQPLLGAPYSIQTRGIFVDDALNVGMGTTTPLADLHVSGPGASLLVQNTGGGVLIDSGSVLLLRTLTTAGTTGVILTDNHIETYAQLTGTRTAIVGTAGGNSAGSVLLRAPDGGLVDTVLIQSDADFLTDATARARITIRSTGFGPGGEVSVLNNDGAETIELLGGATAQSGTFSMFDHATQNSFFYVWRDPSIGAGGRLSVARNDQGDQGFVVDGNYFGTESANVFIHGTPSPMGFFTDLAGDPSVVLPTDSISSTETGNEPGVASLASNALTTLTGAVDTILSRSITCPTDGYCLVMATGQANMTHTNGTSSNANFGVSDTSASLPINQDVALSFSSTIPTGSFTVPVSVHGLFDVAAGSQTFYFLGNENNGAMSVNDPQLTIVFFPTAYGTVTPTILARAGDSDDNTLPILPMSAYDIQAEQMQAIATENARRDAEAAEYENRIAALEDRMRRFEDEQAPRHATPPDPNRDDSGVLRGDAASPDQPSNLQESPLRSNRR